MKRMEVTEVEAGNKQCPFKLREDGFFGRCSGKSCMAWVNTGGDNFMRDDGTLLRNYRDEGKYRGKWVEIGVCGRIPAIE